MSDKYLLISDLTHGGAATSCRRLLAALRRTASVDTQWVAAAGKQEEDAIIADRWPDLPSMLAYRLALKLGMSRKLVSRLARFAFECSTLREIRRLQPGVLNVHNVHSAMTFSFIKRLPARVPMVWTLHDVWPLTGYCCANYECTEYVDGCAGKCPESGNWGPGSVAPAREWHRRQRFYTRNAARMIFVAPSKWLADCARKRFGDMIRVEHIPYSLDLGMFKPIADKAALRRVLGLPVDRRIILAGSAALTEERKGIKYLIEAERLLKEMVRDGFVVATFGPCADTSVLPEGWRHFGEIREEKLLNLYYNAADAFVLPSLWDNLPNTLIEATAAGTPCVTFDVGGCPEVVRDGKTGFVAKYKDAADLAACIERVLTMPAAEYERMSAECRKVAVTEYAPEAQAGRYEKLFNEMTSRQIITEGREDRPFDRLRDSVREILLPTNHTN